MASEVQPCGDGGREGYNSTSEAVLFAVTEAANEGEGSQDGVNEPAAAHGGGNEDSVLQEIGREVAGLQETSPWANLLPDFCNLILNRADVISLFRFHAVCRDWDAAANNTEHPRFPSGAPMLLTSSLNPEGYDVEYNLEAGAFGLHDVATGKSYYANQGLAQSDMGRWQGRLVGDNGLKLQARPLQSDHQCQYPFAVLRNNPRSSSDGGRRPYSGCVLRPSGSLGPSNVLDTISPSAEGVTM